MKHSALRLTDVAMRGPTGERDNIRRLVESVEHLLPRGKVTVAHIEHDDGCPCVEVGRDLTDCTCETVNITLERVPLGR